MYQRRAAYAGSFYPGNADELSRVIDRYLTAAAGGPRLEKIRGLVVPHAGYIYSGPVAAHSYAQLAGSDVSVAVVLAPSHRARFNGAAIMTAGTYETPLGSVPIDEPLAAAVAAHEGFGMLREAHDQEHSLEVQVPFLQTVIPGFSLVPIVVGTVDPETCDRIGAGVAAALADERRSWIIVISTDLSHYHGYDTARIMDGRFIEALKTGDRETVERLLGSGKAEACGHGPVLAGMAACAALGANRVEILNYANSGDTAGPKDQVVGYLAAALVEAA